VCSRARCLLHRKHKVKQRGRENIQPGLAWQSRQGEQRSGGVGMEGIRFSKASAKPFALWFHPHLLRAATSNYDHGGRRSLMVCRYDSSLQEYKHF
jgi:hypothetical protein